MVGRGGREGKGKGRLLPDRRLSLCFLETFGIMSGSQKNFEGEKWDYVNLFQEHNILVSKEEENTSNISV